MVYLHGLMMQKELDVLILAKQQAKSLEATKKSSFFKERMGALVKSTRTMNKVRSKYDDLQEEHDEKFKENWSEEAVRNECNSLFQGLVDTIVKENEKEEKKKNALDKAHARAVRDLLPKSPTEHLDALVALFNSKGKGKGKGGGKGKGKGKSSADFFVNYYGLWQASGDGSVSYGDYSKSTDEDPTFKAAAASISQFIVDEATYGALAEKRSLHSTHIGQKKANPQRELG